MLLVEIKYPIKTEITNKANVDKVNIFYALLSYYSFHQLKTFIPLSKLFLKLKSFGREP
jgi:hypothetical protein